MVGLLSSSKTLILEPSSLMEKEVKGESAILVGLKSMNSRLAVSSGSVLKHFL